MQHKQTFTLTFLNEETAKRALAAYRGGKDDACRVEQDGELWKLVITVCAKAPSKGKS